MASVVGPAGPVQRRQLPAMGSPGGWPRTASGGALHSRLPPARGVVDCPLVHECTDDGCNCHYGAFL